MSKRLKLTDAQIFTLRRMYNGTQYFMRGDKQKGEQDKLSHRVNCPSIPVLFREGLVNWRNPACRKFDGLYYSVNLTPSGFDAVVDGKTSKERAA